MNPDDSAPASVPVQRDAVPEPQPEAPFQPAPPEATPQPAAQPAPEAQLTPEPQPQPSVAAADGPFGPNWAPQAAPSPYLQPNWPGPSELRGAAVPAAVVAGGLAFAAFVPLTRTGIGWFAAGLVTLIAVVVATYRGNSAPSADAAEVPRAERIIRLGWGVAALALLSVLTFRNAWWLVTFCVLGALGCTALALVGGRSIRSILFSLVVAPIATLRALPWVSRHLDTLRRGQTNPGASKRLLWSVIVTITFLLVFGALFASADAAFSELLSQITPVIDAEAVMTWVFLFVVGALLVGGAVYLLAAPPNLSSMDTPSPRRLGRAEWVLPIGALVLLFGGFVSVQIAVLFGGERHVLATAGLDYAEYARSGFWQLAWVTFLALLIVAGLARWASRESRADRITLRVLLGLLSGLSVVIVASALSRMYTYQQAYSFTGERIFVMAFEFLLGAVFVLILLAGIRLRGSWVPRTVVGLAVVMLLSLAVLNPEQYAAERNVQRYEETGKIDLWYLRALSADATPTLARLPEDLRKCTLMWITDDLRENDPWYAWNLGRQEAREVLARLGPNAAGDCQNASKYDYSKTR